MQLKNYNTYFFFLVLAGVSLLTFFIFQPFLLAIVIAAIMAVVFQGPYHFLLKLSGGRQGFSAFVTMLGALLIFMVPFVVILGLIGNELLNLYKSTLANGDNFARLTDYLFNLINHNQLLTRLGFGGVFNKEALVASFAQFGQWVLVFATGVYASVAHVIFMSFVALFSLYYFLREGREIVQKIMYVSPLKDAQEKLLIGKFVSISRATIKGTLIMGILQGSLGGLIFFIAGIPSAVTWGAVMMVMSLVPFVGSGIVWFPAGVILLLLGRIEQGVLVLLFGLLVISTLDNFLRPRLVGRDTQMHPLMVLFATVGGLSFFGVAGFIVGPVVAALFLALWEIYGVEFRAQLRRYNK